MAQPESPAEERPHAPALSVVRERRLVLQCIHLLLEEYGLRIDDASLPRIRIPLEKTGAHHRPSTGTIVIGAHDLQNESFRGTAIGEEVGHYLRRHYSRTITDDLLRRLGEAYDREDDAEGATSARSSQDHVFDQRQETSTELREQLRQFDSPIERNVSEENTSEFFGFVGRRLLYNASQNHPELPPLFKEEPRDTQPKMLDDLRTIRKRLREVTAPPCSTTRLQSIRSDTLRHARGYHYASRLDLSQIHDWEKFFSLPDTEVRRRFFGSEPDYSGL